MRTILSFVLMTALLTMLASCGTETLSPSSGDDGSDDSGDTGDTGGDTTSTLAEALAANGDAPEDPGETWRELTASSVSFDGSTVETDAAGATWSDGVLTLTRSGCYRLSGELEDGRIVVDVDDGQVTLVLDDLALACSSGSPLSIEDADPVLIYLPEGTRNTLVDGATYVFDDPDEDEPNATLFSRDDLVIDGPGALSITGAYNDGITSKDGLLILDGEIEIDAVDDGIRGKDVLAIRGGTLDVVAGGDGLKSDEDEDASLGYIHVTGGDLRIDADGDGLVGETDVLIGGGSLDVTSGGGHDAWLSSSESAKGLKAGVLLAVADGALSIDAADDALHSDDAILIAGGELEMASGDDGIHGELRLDVEAGVIEITDCYEGLESAALSISGGTIRVSSSDDALNAAGGTTNTFVMSGGYVYADALGDGVDCNGSITMSGGTLLVNGPTSSSNSAIDYDGRFTITGGYLAAVGSDGMAQTAGSSSSQNALLARFSQVSAGRLVHLQTADGTDLCTFTSTRRFTSLAFSSPDLTTGGSYKLYTGGSCDGTETDGLYEGGTYTPGSLAASFSVSQRVTTVR